MRLIDITVNEVSLVDKAANKRKFAFMKRETVVVNKEEIKAEVKEATKIIEATTVVTPAEVKLTPEQLKEVAALNDIVTELVAQFKKQSK